MTGRGVLVQAGLALAALLAAYFTWQRQPELHEGEVLVVDMMRNELERIRFDDGETGTWVELGRERDASGPFPALRLSARQEPAVAGRPPSTTPERLVRGNDLAQKLLDRFAPLRASRALGVLDAGKQKDLGLDTSKKRIDITSRTGRRTFTVTPAPPGGTEPYLRDGSDGRVFVIARQILTDLQSARSSLVERRLHGFRLDEADRLLIAAGGNKKEYRASRDEDGRGLRLTPAGSPDSADDSARTWHERVWALWPAEILGRDEIPTEGAPEVRLRIDYFARDKHLGWLELAERPTPAGGLSAPGVAPKKALFARSEFGLGWAKLSDDAQPIIDQAAKLFGR